MNPQSNQKSREEYLAMLDDIAKLKKKTGLSIASDQSGVVPEVLGTAPARPGTVAYGTPIASNFPKLQDRTYNPPSGTINDGQNYDSNTMDYATFLQNLNGNKQMQSTPYGGYSDQEAVHQATGLPYGVQTLPDGGVLYNDGSIKYEDGTVREGDSIDPSAYGIRTNEDGSAQYSDGSIRRPAFSSQETLTQETVNPQYYQDFAGIGGLSNFVFGKENPVTQDYMNYNPNRFYTYNQGIDFGTIGQDSPVLKFPVDAEVVEVMNWDGLPPESTQTPYGNSVLIKLSNGQMLRLSHLDQMGNLKPGDTIPANEVFGTPGATGNTTAQHLDVEFYNAQGQIDDPKNFFIEMKKQSEATPAPQQSTPTDTPPQPTPTDIPPVDNNPITSFAKDIEYLKPTGDYGVGATELLQGDIKGAGQELANTIEKIRPTGNVGIGATELMKGDVAGAKEELANTGNLFKDEFAKVGTGLREGFGNIFADLGRGLNLKDRGISELISGPVSAGEPGVNEPLQSRQDYLDTALNAAGQGISKLKNVFSGVASNFVGNNMADMDTRKIGGSPASLPAESMMTPKDKFQSTQTGMNNVFKSVATPTQSTSVAKSTSQNVSRPQQSSNSNSSNNNNNNQSSNNNSNQNRNSSPAPQQSRAPAPVYQSKAPAPVYQSKAPAPVYQSKAPAPAPKPAPAPAPKQNVFTNLVNTIKSWFKR